MEDGVRAIVTKTIDVEMLPFEGHVYFDVDGKNRKVDPKTGELEDRREQILVRYGEYHDGLLYRELAMQEAPPEDAEAILDAFYTAMEMKAIATVASAKAKDPKDWDVNEQYVMAVLAAGGLV